MQPTELERYLREQIPLVRAMDITVAEVGDAGVVLRAPLAPNRNHFDTAFGGSVAAIAILSAWSLLHVRLQAAGFVARIVVRQSTVEYEQAIHHDFIARAPAPAEEEWLDFLRMLERRGKARITLTSALEDAGVPAARFTGDFVASLVRAE